MLSSNHFKFSFSKQYILLYIFLSFSLYSKVNSLNTREPLEDHKEKFNSYYNENNTDSSSEDADISAEDITVVMNFSYPVYLILCLLLICSACKYEGTENLQNGIWLFMYLANNGYIIISLGIAEFSHYDEYALYFLIPELVVLGIGTIIFIYKLYKMGCENCVELFFSCQAIRFIFALPCICVWPILKLTDDCCRQDTYTVTTYADGHTESNESCVRFCNCLVYFLKRLAMIVSTIIYYIFAIILTIALLIIMGIIAIITCIALATCCKDKEIAPATEGNGNEQFINNGANNQTPVQNATELNVNYQQNDGNNNTNLNMDQSGNVNTYQNMQQNENPNPYPNMDQNVYVNPNPNPNMDQNAYPNQYPNDIPVSNVPQYNNY